MIPIVPSKYILKNILEKNVDEKYFLESKKTKMILENTTFSNEFKTPIKKLFTISRDFHKDNERQRRVYSIDGKSPTLLARSDTPKIYIEEKNKTYPRSVKGFKVYQIIIQALAVIRRDIK